MRQFRQTPAQLVIFFRVRSIPKAGSSDVGQLAGFTLTRGELFDQIGRVRTPLYELSPFFISSAFSISRSRLKSATNFFQPSVLVFQMVQSRRLARFDSAVLGLPGVNRVRAHADFPRHLGRGSACFQLFHHRQDLLFGELPFCHAFPFLRPN
jgi:hypothetical protein